MTTAVANYVRMRHGKRVEVTRNDEAEFCEWTIAPSLPRLYTGFPELECGTFIVSNNANRRGMSKYELILEGRNALRGGGGQSWRPLSAPGSCIRGLQLCQAIVCLDKLPRNVCAKSQRYIWQRKNSAMLLKA